MTARTYNYRGYQIVRQDCYRRGEYGAWRVMRDGREFEEVCSLADARWYIDRHPDAGPRPSERVRKVTRIKTPRVISDAGRHTMHAFSHETNDCVPRAIAHARCISYAEAHEICRVQFGRKDRGGTRGCEYSLGKMPWARKAFERVWDRNEHRWRTVTLDRFVAEHPVGHFIVLVDRHALAVCDGVVYDGWAISGLKRVESAFEVIA
jgi:hypothetical protein